MAGASLAVPIRDRQAARDARRDYCVRSMAIVKLDTTGGSRSSESDEATVLHALRLRAADALERAYRFLEAQPDEWARLRARVLCGAEPAGRLAERIERSQRADGHCPLGTLISGGGLGFPVLALDRADPDEVAMLGTLEAFLVAADAGLFHGDWLERAVRACEARQSPDGAFRIRGPIFAASDEALSADLFFTGMIAGMLGRTPVSKADGLERAGEFVVSHFSPDAVEHDGYPALMACSLFFTNVGHERSDELLQWCGRALEKGFRSGRIDAVATMRVLLSCDAQAMPGATFDVVELLDRLLAEQAGDGGFSELSLSGPAGRTTQTFDAMLAIVRLCSVLPVLSE
jgi:hypothetical protein